MFSSKDLHQIISRARKLVGALLDSASLINPDAKSVITWPYNQLSAFKKALGCPFSKVLIRFKDA